jgi:hypothetical protein
MSMIVYRDISPNVGERFDPKRYRDRMEAFGEIADRFGCTVSSGALRSNTGSLHDKERGGLAGDLGAGTGNAAARKEQAACAFMAQATYRNWRGQKRHLFQEVLWHGPPDHCHGAFYPGIKNHARKVRKALRRYER